MTTDLLMPKGTALWLIHNTKLSFKQIATFCGMHILEIQNLADSEAFLVAPFDPIAAGQLTPAEIKRCEDDSAASLKMNKVADLVKKKSNAKYVPIAKRSDRPNGILWIVRNFPKVTDMEIKTLLGGTVKMIQEIRVKTYSRYDSLIPQNPASLNLCELDVLNAIIDESEKRVTVEVGAD